MTVRNVYVVLRSYDYQGEEFLSAHRTLEGAQKAKRKDRNNADRHTIVKTAVSE